MPKIRTCLLICLCVTLQACIFASSDDDDDGWNVTNNDNNKPEPYDAVTLTLKNLGSAPIFYEKNGGVPIRVLDADGQYVQINEPLCNCEGPCPVGLQPLDQAAPEPTYILSGDQAQLKWDGTIWVPKGDANNCLVESKAAKGTTFKAQFCHSKTFSSTYDQALLVDNTCEERTFKIGEDKAVDYEANRSLDDEPTMTFQLVNNTRVTLELRSNCRSNPFTLHQMTFFAGQQEQEIHVSPICDGTTKVCGDELDPEFCLVDGACALVTVGPGQTFEYQWNNLSWVKHPLWQGAEGCQLHQPVPRGPARVEVCYRPMNAPGDMVKCDEKMVDVGKEATVEFVVGMSP